MLYWGWVDEGAVERLPSIRSKPFVSLLPAHLQARIIERICAVEYYKAHDELYDMQLLLAKKHKPDNLNGGARLAENGRKYGDMLVFGHNPYVNVQIGVNIRLGSEKCGCDNLTWRLQGTRSFFQKYEHHDCGKVRKVSHIKL